MPTAGGGHGSGCAHLGGRRDNDCGGLVDGDDPDCAPPVDCSQFSDRKSRNAEAACRWDSKNQLCLAR